MFGAIVIVNPHERDATSRLLIDDIEVGSANYDEHGSAGLELLAQIAENLADLAGVELEEKWEDD